jgi:hypothetical protein
MLLTISLFALTLRHPVQAPTGPATLDELNWVISYCEANLPCFQDDVTPKTRPSYERMKDRLRKLAPQVQSRGDAYKLIASYVEFFHDNHSTLRVYGSQVNEANPADVLSFQQSEPFRTCEQVELRPEDLKQYPVADVRGLYENADGTYKIAVIPKAGLMRKYAGVVVESKTPLWKPGQVKFELNPTGKSTFDAFLYDRGHGCELVHRADLSHGILADRWFKTSIKTRKNERTNAPAGLEVRELDASTCYVRIPTFSGSQTDVLNKFYSEHERAIRSHPFLIIDVRNNGGGSDGNALPLLGYFYTRPVKMDFVELYVTKANIQAFEERVALYKKDPVNYSKGYVKAAESELSAMKAAPLQSFILRGGGDVLPFGRVLETPKRVAILTNRYCASACEALLFWAKQSDKAIIMGENSGGYVGYGEVDDVQTPSFKFSLSCTKTRYRVQRQFEATGIEPDVALDPNLDWIMQASDVLRSDSRCEAALKLRQKRWKGL